MIGPDRFVLREATPTELEAWDILVGRFSNSRLFHRKAWIESVKRFSGASPLYLVYETDGEIAACFPGLLQTYGMLTLFGSPREGWQTDSLGPVYDPRRISTREIVRSLVGYLEHRYGVDHIEFSSTSLDPAEIQADGFEIQRLFTYRVPLYPGAPDRAFANVKKKTRNQIRKAIKLGLEATVETDERFVAEFYSQSREVFARRGHAMPFSYHRALQCFQALRSADALLALAVRLPDSGKAIGTAIFMADGKELNLWGWAHRTEYRWYCPTELMTWTAMRVAMERGCETFDMSGGGLAKVKFGAVPDHRNCRWLRSRYSWLGTLRSGARVAFRVQQSARGRMIRGGFKLAGCLKALSERRNDQTKTSGEELAGQD